MELGKRDINLEHTIAKSSPLIRLVEPASELQSCVYAAGMPIPSGIFATVPLGIVWREYRSWRIRLMRYCSDLGFTDVKINLNLGNKQT